MPLPSSGIILVEKPTGKQTVCIEGIQQQQQQTSSSRQQQQQSKSKQKFQAQQQILSVPLTATAPLASHAELNNVRFRPAQQQRGRGSKQFHQQQQYQDAIVDNFNKSNSSGSSNGTVALNASALKRQRQRNNSGSISTSYINTNNNNNNNTGANSTTTSTTTTTIITATTLSGINQIHQQQQQPQPQARFIQLSEEQLYEQTVIKSGCDVGETVAAVINNRTNSSNCNDNNSNNNNNKNNNMILSTTEMINQQQVYKIVTADGTTGNMIIDTLGNVTTTSGAQIASVSGHGAGASVVVNNASAAGTSHAPSGTGASKMLLGNLTVLSKHHHHPVTAVSALTTPTMNSINSTTTAPVQQQQQQQSQHPQTINFVNAKNLPYLTSNSSGTSLTSPSAATTTYASVAAAANGSKQKFALTSSAYKSSGNISKQQHQQTPSSTAFLLQQQQQQQKHGNSTTGAVAAITTRPVQMVTRVQTLLQPASSSALQQQQQQHQHQQTHQPQIVLQQQHPQTKHALVNKLGTSTSSSVISSGGHNFKKSMIKMPVTNKQLSTAITSATVQQHTVGVSTVNLSAKTTFLQQQHHPQQQQQQQHFQASVVSSVGKTKTTKLVKQYNNAINNSASSLGTYTINHQKFSSVSAAQLQNTGSGTTKVGKLSNKYILQQPHQLHQGQQSQQQNATQLQQHIVSLPHGTHLQHKGVLPTSSSSAGTTTHHFNSNTPNITSVSAGNTTTTIYQHLTSNSNATIAAAAASGTIKFVNAHGTVIQQHPGTTSLQNTSSAVMTSTNTTSTVATIAPIVPSSSTAVTLSSASVSASSSSQATTAPSTLFADDIVIVNGTQMTDELSARILQSMSQKSYSNSQQRYQQHQQHKIGNNMPPPHATAATTQHQQQISNILPASKDYQLYSPMQQQASTSSSPATSAAATANIVACQQQQQQTLLSPSIAAATTCLPSFIQQQHNVNVSSSNSVVSSYTALGSNVGVVGGAVSVPVSPVSITYMAAPSIGTAAAITAGNNNNRLAHSAPGSRSHSLERKYSETTVTRKGTDIYKLNSNNGSIANALRNSASATMSGVTLTAPTEQQQQQSYLQVQQHQQQQQHTQVIHLQTLKSAPTSFSTTSQASSTISMPISNISVAAGSISQCSNSNYSSLNNSNNANNDEDIIGEEIRPVPVLTQDIRLQILHAVLQDHTYANAMPTRLPSDFNVMLPATTTMTAANSSSSNSLLTSVVSGNNVAQYVNSLAAATATVPTTTTSSSSSSAITTTMMNAHQQQQQQLQQQQWSLSGYSTTVTAMSNNSQQATHQQQQNLHSSYTTIYGQSIPRLQQQDDDAHSAISNGSRQALGDIDPGEETETAPEAEAEDDSITRCICDLTHDDGYMICCDKCSAWQHVDCMGIDRTNIPDEYLCELCQPRPVSKTRARQIQMQKRRDQAQAVITVPAIVNASMGMSNVPASVGLLSKDSVINMQQLQHQQQQQQRSLSGSISGSDGALHTLSNAALSLSGSGIGAPYLSNSSYTTKKSKMLRKTKDSPAAGTGLTPTGRKSKKADKLAAAAAAAAGQTLPGKPMRKEPRKNAKRKTKAGALAAAGAGTSVGSEMASSGGSSSGGPGANTAAGKHAANLRNWIEKYELAVTNHYSPELRARLQAITKQPSLLQSIINTENKTLKDCGNLDNRATTVPHAGGKILISNLDIGPNFPIFELRGKFMLMSQYRTQNATVNMNSPPPTNYQLIASHKAHKTPGPFIFFYQLPGAEVPMQTMNPDGTYPPQPPQPAYLKGPEICVDTRTYGNEARFVRRSCRPNAEIQHLFEKGTIHLFLVSLTTIRASTEITIRHEPHDLAAVETRKSSALIVKPTSTACACGLTNDCLFGPPLPKFTPGASKPGRKSAAQLRSDKKAYQSIGSSSSGTQLTLPAGNMPEVAGAGGVATLTQSAGGKKKSTQSSLNRNRSTSSSGDSNIGGACAAISTGLISPNITQMHLGGNVAVGSSSSSGGNAGIQITAPNSIINNSNSLQKSTLLPNNIIVPNNVLALSACGNSSSMHDSGICTSSSSPSVSIPSPTPQNMHSPTQQLQQQQQQTNVLQRTLVMQQQQQQQQPQQLPSAQQQQQQVLAALPASMLLSSQQIQQQPLAVMAAAAAAAATQMQMQINVVDSCSSSGAQKSATTNVSSIARQRHVSESSNGVLQQQQPQVQKSEPASSVEIAAAAAALQSLNSAGGQLSNSSSLKELQQQSQENSILDCRQHKQQQEQQLKSNVIVNEQTTSNETKHHQQQQNSKTNNVVGGDGTPSVATSTPMKATPQKHPHGGGSSGSHRKTPGTKHARQTSVSESSTSVKSNSAENGQSTHPESTSGLNELTATTTVAAAAATSTPKEKPKLSREDRKMEAILRAIEKMERTQQRKKEPKATKTTIAKRRQNEAAAAKRAGLDANSSGELEARSSTNSMKRATHVTRKKKRKSSKSYTNTLAMQRKRHKSRISSNDSEADADESYGRSGRKASLSESEGTTLLSPKNATPRKANDETITKPSDDDTKRTSHATGLLMEFASHTAGGELSTSGGGDAVCFKSPQRGNTNSASATNMTSTSNSDTTVSPPETPPAPVSSACMLIEAAVAPLDAFVGGAGSGSGNAEFKYPSKAKTKKSLMSHWLHQSESELEAGTNTDTNVTDGRTDDDVGLRSLIKVAMSDYNKQQQKQSKQTDSSEEQRVPQNLSVAALKVEEFIFQTERSSSPMNLTSHQQQQHQSFYTLSSDGAVLNDQQQLTEMSQGTSPAVRNLQLPLQQVSTCSNNSSVKKRWLRQAISEETDDCGNTTTPAGTSPSSILMSPGISCAVPNGFTTPLKKRRLVINSKDEPQTTDDDADSGSAQISTTPTPTTLTSVGETETTTNDEQTDWAHTDEAVVHVFKCEAEEFVDENVDEAGQSTEIETETTITIKSDNNQAIEEEEDQRLHLRIKKSQESTLIDSTPQQTRTKAASKQFENVAILEPESKDVKPLKLKEEIVDPAEEDDYKTAFEPFEPALNPNYHQLADQDDDVDIMRSPSPGPKIVAEDNLVKIEPEDVTGSEDVKIDVEREESLANDNFEEIIIRKKDKAAEEEILIKSELVKTEITDNVLNVSSVSTEASSSTMYNNKSLEPSSEAASSSKKSKDEKSEKSEMKCKKITSKEHLSQRIFKQNSFEDEDEDDTDEPLEKKPKLTKTTTVSSAAVSPDADFFDVDEPPKDELHSPLPMLCIVGSGKLKRESTTPPANSTADSLINRQQLSDDDLQDRLTLFHEENIMLLQARNKQQSLESLLQLDTTTKTSVATALSESSTVTTRAETPDYNKFELDTVKPSSESPPLHPFLYVEGPVSSSNASKSTSASGSRSKHTNKSNSYRKSRDRDRKRRRSRSRDSRRRSRDRRPRSGSREHRSSYRSYERTRSRERSSYERERSYERNRSRERSSYDYPRDHSRERTGTGTGYYGNSSSSHNSYSGHSSGHSSGSTTISSQHSSSYSSGKKSGSWSSSKLTKKPSSMMSGEQHTYNSAVITPSTLPFGVSTNSNSSKCEKSSSSRYRSTSSSSTSGGGGLAPTTTIPINVSSNRKRLNFDQIEGSNKYSRREGDEIVVPAKHRSYDGGENIQLQNLHSQYNAQRSLSSSSLGSSSVASDVCSSEMVYSIPVIGSGNTTPALVPIAVTPPVETAVLQSTTTLPQPMPVASYPANSIQVAPPITPMQIMREHPTIPHFNNPLSTIPPPPPTQTPQTLAPTTAPVTISKSNALEPTTTPTSGAVSQTATATIEHFQDSSINSIPTNSNCLPPSNVNLPFYNTVYGKLLDNIAPAVSASTATLAITTSTQVVDSSGNNASGGVSADNADGTAGTAATQTHSNNDVAADAINGCGGSGSGSGITSNCFENKTKEYHHNSASISGYVSHSALFGLGGTAKTGSSGITHSSSGIGQSTTDATCSSSSVSTLGVRGGIENKSTCNAASSGSLSSSSTSMGIGKISMLTKTASHDPRLNPILSAPEPPPVPKRKLSINEYRRRMKQSSSSNSSTESTSISTVTTTPTTPDVNLSTMTGGSAAADDGGTNSSPTLSRCTLNSPDDFATNNRYRGCLNSKAVEKSIISLAALNSNVNSSSSNSKSGNSNLDGDLYSGIDSPPQTSTPSALLPLKRSSIDDDSKKGGQFNAAPTLLEKQQEKLCERLKSLKSQQAVLKSSKVGNYEYNNSSNCSSSSSSNSLNLNSNNSSFLLNRNSSFQQQQIKGVVTINNDLLDNCLEAISSTSTSLESSRDSSPERITQTTTIATATATICSEGNKQKTIITKPTTTTTTSTIAQLKRSENLHHHHQQQQQQRQQQQQQHLHDEPENVKKIIQENNNARKTMPPNTQTTTTTTASATTTTTNAAAAATTTTMADLKSRTAINCQQQQQQPQQPNSPKEN